MTPDREEEAARSQEAVAGEQRRPEDEEDTRGVGPLHERSDRRSSSGWRPPRPVRRLEPDITTEELKRIRREGGPDPAAPNVGWWVPREAVDEGEDTGGGRPPNAA